MLPLKTGTTKQALKKIFSNNAIILKFQEELS